jgi:hypothetical protein
MLSGVVEARAQRANLRFARHAAYTRPGKGLCLFSSVAMRRVLASSAVSLRSLLVSYDTMALNHIIALQGLGNDIVEI